MSSIAQNTAFMTIASVGQKVISLVYFLILARVFSPGDIGKYAFALSFTTMFVVLVDLGLTNVLVREGSRWREKLQSYLSTVLSIKVGLGIVAYGLVILAINAMGKPDIVKELVYLSGVTMLFDSTHLSLYGILRALGNLRYEAIGMVVSQFLTFILGGIFISLRLPLLFLMLAFTIPSALNAAFAAGVLWKKYRIHPFPRFNGQIGSMFLRIAVPFALAALFARVYASIDSILLSEFAGDEALGWYSLAYKMAYAFQFVPVALIAAMYPRFSEMFAKDKERLATVFEQSMKYLLLVIAPIAVGIALLSKQIILFLYTPAYAPSIPVLQILMASVVFSFVSFPIGAMLNACNRQGRQTAIIAGVTGVNIIVNLFLIPRFGALGAAIVGLLCNMLLAGIGYFSLRQLAPISHRFLLKTIAQTAIASGGMGFVVYVGRSLSPFITLFITIFSGAVMYALLLFITGALDRNEVRTAMQILKSHRDSDVMDMQTKTPDHS